MPKKFKPNKENKGSSSSRGHDQGSGGKGEHAQGSAGNSEHSNAGGSWMKSPKQGEIPGIKTKDGCFPKAAMLLMPFIAFGAYLFLR